MSYNLQKKDKGFTIIEVVLVLAIAGLIFLMVFIALPALQRGQRDTQRKNDLSRVLTSIQNYQTNNRGALPTNYADFTTKYLVAGSDKFNDPSTGDIYTFFDQSGDIRVLPTEPVSKPDNSKIFYYNKASCEGETIVASGGNKVAFAMKLEGGGIACQSN